MSNLIDKIIGSRDEKRAYRKIEARAKALPAEYSVAYKEIKHYVFTTAGVMTIAPLGALVDLLEDAAADGKHVLDVTGPDVAAFADELVRGEHSYFGQQRQKLNDTIEGKLKRARYES